MGNEVMFGVRDRKPTSLQLQAKALAGHARCVQLALEHALLWQQWKMLNAACRETDDNAELVAMNRRMADLDREMADTFSAFTKSAAYHTSKQEGANNG